MKNLAKFFFLLGYIPELQEARFSDNCDMLTWYERYRVVVPELEEEVSKRITKQKQT